MKKKTRNLLSLGLVFHVLTYYLLFARKLEWPSCFASFASLFLLYFAFKDLCELGYFADHKLLKYGIILYSFLSLVLFAWTEVNPSPIPMYREISNPFYRSIGKGNGFHPLFALSCASGWWYWEKDKRRRGQGKSVNK